jgi:hypothetical protein
VELSERSFIPAPDVPSRQSNVKRSTTILRESAVPDRQVKGP